MRLFLVVRRCSAVQRECPRRCLGAVRMPSAFSLCCSFVLWFGGGAVGAVLGGLGAESSLPLGGDVFALPALFRCCSDCFRVLSGLRRSCCLVLVVSG